jgi:hypothetical protein
MKPKQHLGQFPDFTAKITRMHYSDINDSVRRLLRGRLPSLNCLKLSLPLIYMVNFFFFSQERAKCTLLAPYG